MVQKLLLYVAVWAVMFALFWLAGACSADPGAYRRGHEPDAVDERATARSTP